jgi:hypothetical protein
MGLRASPKEESAVSLAELVFGAPLTLPGQLLSMPETPVQEVVVAMRSMQPPPTHNGGLQFNPSGLHWGGGGPLWRMKSPNCGEGNSATLAVYLFPDFMCQSITIAQRIKSLVRIARILFRVSLQFPHFLIQIIVLAACFRKTGGGAPLRSSDVIRIDLVG